MKKQLFGLAIAAMALALPASAFATPVTMYDYTLSSPAFFNGTGNPSGGFTTTTDGAYELSLRAKYRQNPAVIDNPTGSLYNVVGGTQTNATSGGNGANASRAAWNYEFDIRTLDGALDTIGNYMQLTITDETAGVTATVNPMLYFCDNSTWGTSGKNPDGNLGNGCSSAFWSTSMASENSENGMFLNFPLNGISGYTFDASAAHYYDFTLGLYNSDKTLILSDTMSVSVDGAKPVPEPGSLMLLGSGLFAAASAARRRFLV